MLGDGLIFCAPAPLLPPPSTPPLSPRINKSLETKNIHDRECIKILSSYRYTSTHLTGGWTETNKHGVGGRTDGRRQFFFPERRTTIIVRCMCGIPVPFRLQRDLFFYCFRCLAQRVSEFSKPKQFLVSPPLLGVPSWRSLFVLLSKIARARGRYIMGTPTPPRPTEIKCSATPAEVYGRCTDDDDGRRRLGACWSYLRTPGRRYFSSCVLLPYHHAAAAITAK